MAIKYLDENGVLYLWNKIISKLTTDLSGKVDKENGKGLSSNDYTSEEKTKLAGIAAGAEVNVNADWNATTGDAAILNRPSIPTATSDLTNDSGFITAADVPDGAVASTTTPKMDGVATVGTETAFARGDHIHPHDTTKVDVVNGKGLSTNDFTNDLKTKLEGIATGADVSVQSDWNASTGKAAILNKPTIPTTTNELTNNSGFITTSALNGYATESYVTTSIGTALSGVTSISYEVVASLPATGEAGVIYLVAHNHGNSDIYDEYIYYNNAFEKIGNTDIDLSDYVEDSDLVAITNAEIDTITGANGSNANSSQAGTGQAG